MFTGGWECLGFVPAGNCGTTFSQYWDMVISWTTLRDVVAIMLGAILVLFVAHRLVRVVLKHV